MKKKRLMSLFPFDDSFIIIWVDTTDNDSFKHESNFWTIIWSRDWLAGWKQLGDCSFAISPVFSPSTKFRIPFFTVLLSFLQFFSMGLSKSGNSYYIEVDKHVTDYFLNNISIFYWMTLDIMFTANQETHKLDLKYKSILFTWFYTLRLLLCLHINWKKTTNC